MDIGPVEYIVVGFEGDRFDGSILSELTKLVEAGTIRVLDVMFVRKDGAGNVEWLELDGLDPEDQGSMGFMDAGMVELLNEDDAHVAVNDLPNGTAVGLLVIEDLWAKDFARSLRDAGGTLLDSNRVPADVVQAAFDYQALPSDIT